MSSSPLSLSPFWEFFLIFVSAVALVKGEMVANGLEMEAGTWFRPSCTGDSGQCGAQYWMLELVWRDDSRNGDWLGSQVG